MDRSPCFDSPFWCLSGITVSFYHVDLAFIVVTLYHNNMMKTIAVISQKGGAGKTTLSVHLAVAAHLAGYGSAIFDLDPQATAEMWGGWRKDAPPEVIAAKAATLRRGLDKARGAGGEVILLDTPGAAAAEALSAAEAADLILIPCRPRSFDLGAIIQTAALARSTGKPAYLVFNATTTRPGPIRAEAREIADSLKLSVAPVRLAERAAFHKATEEGRTAQELEPAGKAAAEVAALWEWVCDRLSMTPIRTDTTEALSNGNAEA